MTRDIAARAKPDPDEALGFLSLARKDRNKFLIAKSAAVTLSRSRRCKFVGTRLSRLPDGIDTAAYSHRRFKPKG
jgi:hypothetical protein